MRVYLLPIPMGLALGVFLAWALGWLSPPPEGTLLAAESGPGVGARPGPSVIRPRYFERVTAPGSTREGPPRVQPRIGRIATESAPEPPRPADPWYARARARTRDGVPAGPGERPNGMGPGIGPPEAESAALTYRPFGPAAASDPWYVYDPLRHGPIPQWGAAAQARYTPQREAPFQPAVVRGERDGEIAPWYVFPPGSRFLDRPEWDRDAEQARRQMQGSP